MAQNTRIIRASKSAKAGIRVDENSVAIVGDDRNLVAVTDQGTFIKGPISLVTDSMNIRRAGLFVDQNDFLRMIPTTIVTPIPLALPIPPIHGLANLAKDVAFFMALLV